jgi:hypothetical protein
MFEVHLFSRLLLYRLCCKRLRVKKCNAKSYVSTCAYRVSGAASNALIYHMYCIFLAALKHNERIPAITISALLKLVQLNPYFAEVVL